MRAASCLPALLICTLAPAQQAALPFDAPQVAFRDSVSITSVGDLDGDGDVDGFGWYWVYANSYTTIALSSYENDGRGVFSLRLTMSGLSVSGGSASSWDTEIGRLNADAYGDFVAVFHTEVRAWTSAPNFGFPSAYGSWTEPWPVRDTVLADFDGDGLDDLALVGNEVRVYGNTGSGFVLAASHPLGGTQLFRGDFDGDARPDLMVPGNGIVTLLRCDSTSIQPIATVTHGVQPSEDPMIVVGDVDNDLDTDIVVFNNTGQYVTLRCAASGAFVPESRSSGGPATGLADIDGDGDLDGVCCGGGGPSPAPNTMPSTYHIAENRGGGVFAPAFTMVGLGGFRLAGAVDVDGDGDRDLVGGRTVWFNRGDIFGVDPEPDLATIQARSYEPISDVDGDGDPDFVVQFDSIWRNDGSGTFARATPLLPTAAPQGTFFRGPGYRGDFDGDGDEDVIVGHWAQLTYLGMRLLRNNGGGGYTDGGPALPAGVPFTNSPNGNQVGELSVVADFDRDGDLDIAQGNDIGINQIVLWANNGSGFFTRGPAFPSSPPVAAADLDGDGNTDLVTTNVLFGNGAGGFVPGTLFVNVLPTTDRCAIADLDHDGRLDLAYFEHAIVGSVIVSWNNGNRAFASTVVLTPAVSSTARRSVDIADFDGDGNPDLMVWPGNSTDRDAPVLLFGNGQRGFPRSVRQVIDPRGLADVDGDGDLDVLGPTIVRSVRSLVPADGLRRQFGNATAGSGGMAPTLGAGGPFHAGATVTMRTTGLLGGTFAVLGIGGGPAAVAGWPLPGLVGHAYPLAAWVGGVATGTLGTAGVGTWALPVAVPAAFTGTEVCLQVWSWDPAAAGSVVQTNGLFLHLR